MVFKPASVFPIVLIVDYNTGWTEKNQDGENKQEGPGPEYGFHVFGLVCLVMPFTAAL